MIRKIQNYINLQICFEAGGIKPSGKQRGLLFAEVLWKLKEDLCDHYFSSFFFIFFEEVLHKQCKKVD